MFIIVVHLVVGIDMIWDWVLCWEADIVTATATVVLAVTSVLASILGFLKYSKEAEKRLRQDRILAYPLVMGQSSYNKIPMEDDMRHVMFQVANRGTSPAIIRNFVLFFDGKEVARNNSRDYFNFLNRMTQEFKDTIFLVLLPDSYIGIGEEKTLWELKYNIKNQNINEIEKIDVLIEYESILQDKIYTYDGRNDRVPDDIEIK